MLIVIDPHKTHGYSDLEEDQNILCIWVSCILFLVDNYPYTYGKIQLQCIVEMLALFLMLFSLFVCICLFVVAVGDDDHDDLVVVVVAVVVVVVVVVAVVVQCCCCCCCCRRRRRHRRRRRRRCCWFVFWLRKSERWKMIIALDLHL